MRAVTLNYDRRILEERDVPEPRIASPTGVLFRVREAGICGTDRELASFRLGYPPSGEEHLIIGHEAVGEVVDAGAESGFAPGQIVVPTVRRACIPPCRLCAENRRDLCVTGRYTERGIFGAHGYFAELAADESSDLIAIPPDASEFAVLVEPLSVVEKAVALAMKLHRGGAETALVVGAGSVGLLAAMVLRLRGFQTSIVSVEPAGSPRARLVESAGVPYLTWPVSGKADIIIEAAGAPGAAGSALEALAPLGVLIILGAVDAQLIPLLSLIVGNQTMAGSVNAGPEAFRQAVADLPRMPRSALAGMVERVGFYDYRRSIAGPPPESPKVVHVFS